MENIYENNILTVKLCKRVDSSNAPDVEKKIMGLIEKNNAKNVVIDCENTDYISSAGLRIVLKLKKITEEYKVVNTSPELYDRY